MIILDTCALLWLAGDQKKLSPRAKKTIDHHANSLLVSSISVFEIGLKCHNKKLSLPLPLRQWFSQTVDFYGITEVPVNSAIAISASELPLLHNDPFDRIVIATAQINNMAVLTCDEHISQYKVKVVW